MVMGSEAIDCGIKKSLIHAGEKKVNYIDGTKVIINRMNLKNSGKFYNLFYAS